jgi:cytochrome c oxidase assembly factor CtaG
MIGWAWTGAQAAAAAAAVALFVRGCRRTGREVVGRALLLAGGLGSLVLALSPPVDHVVDASFTAHMAQHLAMVVVAAPLLVAADPVPSILAGLASWLRRPVSSIHRGARGAGVRPPHPAAAFSAHMGALVVWHVPALFDAAVENVGVHTLEHASFVVTALWFWAPVLTVRGRRRLTEVGAVVYLVAAGAICSAIGALLTFASSPLYPTYARDGAIPALRDQQLAGVLMWVPPGVVYVVVAAVVLWRWLENAERGEDVAFAAAAGPVATDGRAARRDVR